jgi:hypothetical protein
VARFGRILRGKAPADRPIQFFSSLLGHPVLILIQSNGIRGEAVAEAGDRVTILAKPVDPARIRAWLSADGRL